MLSRLIRSDTSDFGKLESRLDEYAKVLVPPELSPKASRARERFRKADVDIRIAQAALAEAVRLHGGGFPIAPAVAAARKALEHAEAAKLTAGKALNQAREDRDREFAQALSDRLAQVSPILEEAADLMWKIVNPLVELHAHAWRQNLPMLNAFEAVPQLQEGVRVLQQLANRASNKTNGHAADGSR
jgi:hypothetical protein